MKIYNLGNTKPPGQLEDASRKKEKGKADEKAVAGQGGDQVRFSKGLQRLMALEKEMQGSPDVRADVVEGLQRKIAQGTYRPNNQDVAGSMLADMFGLPPEE